MFNNQPLRTCRQSALSGWQTCVCDGLRYHPFPAPTSCCPPLPAPPPQPPTPNPFAPPPPRARSHLFRYYHERLPSNFPFPAIPAWKAGDSPDRDDGEEGEDEALPHMAHDDVIGEAVSAETGRD